MLLLCICVTQNAFIYIYYICIYMLYILYIYYIYYIYIYIIYIRYITYIYIYINESMDIYIYKRNRNLEWSWIYHNNIVKLRRLLKRDCVNLTRFKVRVKVQKWKIGNKLILTIIQRNPGKTKNCIWKIKILNKKN